MKKVLTLVLGVIFFSALVIAGGENPDGSCNLAATLGGILVALSSGAGIVKLNPQIFKED